MLLQSPLAHDPDAVVVRRKCVLTQSCSESSHHLSESPALTEQRMTSEIFWNFARLEGRASARFTLEKNPRFYFDLPAHEGAFGPGFVKDPTQFHFPTLPRQESQDDFDTVYVLVDRPGRVFLEAERRPRIFGNVWTLNGTLIFKGLSPPPTHT